MPVPDCAGYGFRSRAMKDEIAPSPQTWAARLLGNEQHIFGTTGPGASCQSEARLRDRAIWQVAQHNRCAEFSKVCCCCLGRQVVPTFCILKRLLKVVVFRGTN